MKKLLGRAIILLVTVTLSCATIICIIVALEMSDWLPGTRVLSGVGYTLLKTREIKKYSNIDVLFLGSSNVYRGIDTRLFEKNNLKAFNLGTTSQSPFNSYYLLKEYMPVVKPKYVVLDLYWPVVAGDGIESTIDIISNHHLTYNMVEMALRSHDMLALRHLIAVSLSRLYKPLNAVEIKQDTNRSVYINGGYVAASYVDSNKKMQDLANLDSRINLPSNRQLEHIQKIIALCKANSAKLLLILVPVSKGFKNKLKNYQEYSSTIADIARKDNILFIDYNQNEKLGLSSDDDYSDKNHMNMYGAGKFTKVLLNDFDLIFPKKHHAIAAK